MKLIDKDALVAEIERKLHFDNNWIEGDKRRQIHTNGVSSAYYKRIGSKHACENILDFVDTLEVIDPYEQCIQYASIEAGIKAHAEDYSFNIESELFNQLTKEQQKLWRKEIEQACISGGCDGVELAKDPRYKENSKMKEVDLEKKEIINKACWWLNNNRLGVIDDDYIKDFRKAMEG